MEPTEHQLSSYFNPTNTAAASLSPTNGLGGPNTQLSQQQQLTSADHNNNHLGVYTVPTPTSSVTSLVEPAKRKRGRPRKYGTPEQALAAKKAATTSSHSSSAKEKKEKHQHGGGSTPPSYSGPSKKAQISAFGNSGQNFTPHVIIVAAGEDVGQKIIVFMQQSKRDICILSASGTISNVSIRQPSTSGGNITHEGRFEIISLCGSFVHTADLGGGKTGALSVTLCNTNGQIIGGGLGGPMIAAGPVQVIVGTFLVDNRKDAGAKVEVSLPRLPSPVGGASMMNVGFRSTVDSSGRNMVKANDEQQQAIGGSHFMIQGMHGSADWRMAGSDGRSTGAYELAGRGGHAAHQSPENGDYDQIPD